MDARPRLDPDFLAAARVACALRGLTYCTISVLSGIDEERVGRLLRAERPPRPGEREALARALGLDREETEGEGGR